MKKKKKYFVSYVEKHLGSQIFESGTFEVRGKNTEDDLVDIKRIIYEDDKNIPAVTILFFNLLCGEGNDK